MLYLLYMCILFCNLPVLYLFLYLPLSNLNLIKCFIYDWRKVFSMRKCISLWLFKHLKYIIKLVWVCMCKHFKKKFVDKLIKWSMTCNHCQLKFSIAQYVNYLVIKDVNSWIFFCIFEFTHREQPPNFHLIINM